MLKMAAVVNEQMYVGFPIDAEFEWLEYWERMKDELVCSSWEELRQK